MTSALMMRMRRLLALAALLLAACTAVAPGALAASSVDQSDIEDEVMCVQCGRPLSTSSGSAADDERDLIQGWIAQGLTKAQIKQRLVAVLGDRALVEDRSPVAAAAPWLAAVIGATSIGLLLRRRRLRDEPEATATSGPDGSANGHGPAAAAPEISAVDAARIDAELAERD